VTHLSSDLPDVPLATFPVSMNGLARAPSSQLRRMLKREKITSSPRVGWLKASQSRQLSIIVPKPRCQHQARRHGNNQRPQSQLGDRPSTLHTDLTPEKCQKTNVICYAEACQDAALGNYAKKIARCLLRLWAQRLNGAECRKAFFWSAQMQSGIVA
jgi:hypothetical protein